MKTALDHLPAKQQTELDRVRSILLDEFEAAIKQGAGGASEWRKGGQVLKIILFGSYARDDWVDEPDNGYLSDFDLLVIVSHAKLTDIADYWWVAENKMLRDPAIGRTVNIIVHTLEEVNDGLRRGEYFWADIAREGILVYGLPGRPLAAPRPASPADAYAMARRDLGKWLSACDRFLKLAQLSTDESRADPVWRKNAAFNLHQATEAAYAGFLLVSTAYFPRSHNIKFLRSLAEDKDRRLIEAWPREHHADRRRFELLKRAYVEARYSDHYDASVEDLEAITACVQHLRDRVRAIGEDRLDALRLRAEETEEGLG